MSDATSPVQLISLLALVVNLVLSGRRQQPLNARSTERHWLFWGAFTLGVVARWLPLPGSLVVVGQLACIFLGAWLTWTAWARRERPLVR